MNFLMIILIILSSMFLFSKTPHILIFSLLASTFISTLVVGLMKSFPWFAYILFMVFLGGALILFTYVSSLSMNLLFTKLNLGQIIFLLPMVVMLTFTLFFIPTSSDLGNFSLNQLNFSELFIKELTSPLSSYIYLYLFIYLLLTLIYIVTMMKTYNAPLRLLK